MPDAGTFSVCPVCLNRVPATRVVEGDDLYLEKSCDTHGRFRTIVRRGNAGIWNVPAPGGTSKETCPKACGNCSHDEYG